MLVSHLLQHFCHVPATWQINVILTSICNHYVKYAHHLKITLLQRCCNVTVPPEFEKTLQTFAYRHWCYNFGRNYVNCSLHFFARMGKTFSSCAKIHQIRIYQVAGNDVWLFDLKMQNKTSVFIHTSSSVSHNFIYLSTPSGNSPLH